MARNQLITAALWLRSILVARFVGLILERMVLMHYKYRNRPAQYGYMKRQKS